MKLLVLSDIHGEHYIMKQVLEREADADAVFFLGDGIRDVDVWQRSHPNCRMYAVRGNCDYEQMWPLEGLAAFDGTLFFYTHGHEYGVKSTMSVIADCPGVQLYSANFLDTTGKGGVRYARRSGICLETQCHPDALNKPQWAQPVTKAGERYHSQTKFLFA